MKAFLIATGVLVTAGLAASIGAGFEAERQDIERERDAVEFERMQLQIQSQTDLDTCLAEVRTRMASATEGKHFTDQQTKIILEHYHAEKDNCFKRYR